MRIGRNSQTASQGPRSLETTGGAAAEDPLHHGHYCLSAATRVELLRVKKQPHPFLHSLLILYNHLFHPPITHTTQSPQWQSPSNSSPPAMARPKPRKATPSAWSTPAGSTMPASPTTRAASMLTILLISITSEAHGSFSQVRHLHQAPRRLRHRHWRRPGHQGYGVMIRSLI